MLQWENKSTQIVQEALLHRDDEIHELRQVIAMKAPGHPKSTPVTLR